MISLLFITPLAGLCFALAAPPWSWFGLAWFSWIPLWWGIDRRSELSPRFRAILGLLWGVGYYSVSLHWVTGLHPLTWLGLSWWSSVTIALGAWIFLILWNTAPIVLWMVLLGWWTDRWWTDRWWTDRWWTDQSWTDQWHWRRSQPLAFGVALWCSLDWLWSHFPIYSGSLAISQSPGNLWLLYHTRWFGPLGISAAIVLINGCLAYGLRSLLHGTSQARIWGSIALSLFLVLEGSGWILGQVTFGAQSTDLKPDPVTIGIIQGNIPTRIKLTPTGIQQSLKTYQQGYEALAQLGVDAVLMPEGALPFVWEGTTRSQSHLYQSIRRFGTLAWVSTFLSQDSNQDFSSQDLLTTSSSGSDLTTGFTQSLIAVEGTGGITSRYNKIKLVPFGEYIPLQSLLGKLLRRLSLMDGSLSPGVWGQTFQTPWGPAAIAICYEPAFAYVIQDQVKRGAQFILTVSNLDPYDTRLMDYQEALNIMRAIENDRWLVAANNTGYSTVISPQGQVQWRSTPQQLVIAPVQIIPRQTRTLYSQTGDRLILIWVWGWAFGPWLWSISRSKA